MGDKKKYSELDITVDREAFVRNEVAPRLKEMDIEASPVWGMMSAQHMVEHLIYITENMLIDHKIQLITPEEHLPKYKAFLMGTFGFIRNFKFPMLPANELVPLKYDNYQSAVEAFEQITERLFEHLDNPAFKTLLHPIYGPLNREEAIMFQFKHTSHHLMQFSLV